jgi:hypothetical protein
LITRFVMGAQRSENVAAFKGKSGSGIGCGCRISAAKVMQSAGANGESEDASVPAALPSGTHFLRLPAALWLALACCAVYLGNLSGPLLFDDEQTITGNPTLSPLRFPGVLLPLQETPVAGRPVVNLSFALNRALLGDSPTAYHAVNLALHMLVTWLAFFLIRITLQHAQLSPSIKSRAGPLAFAATLLFGVHPIGVELVLYATQRTESLVALFYLAALLILATSARRGITTVTQIALMLACSLLGAGSKEVFATAPLLALFFDRAFFAGSFAGALRARAGLYLALAVSWVPTLILQHGHPRPFSVGFVELDYLLAQAKIIPGYFMTVFWPAHPVLDYGPLLPQSDPDKWLWLALGGLVVLAGARLAFTRPRLGFLAVCVLGILAPSSSLFSVHTEVGAERRMYLPLLVLLVYACLGLSLLFDRFAARVSLSAGMRSRLQVLAVCAAALALGEKARAYGASFESPQRAWSTAAAARPQNPRAHYNLAETYRREGNLVAAEAAYRAALRSLRRRAQQSRRLAAAPWGAARGTASRRAGCSACAGRCAGPLQLRCGAGGQRQHAPGHRAATGGSSAAPSVR